MSSIDVIAQNGWTAVPVDAGKLFNGKPYINKPTPLLVADIKFPSDDPLVAKVQQYAKEQLPIQTFNHSLRAYYYATAIIKQQFPQYAETISPSTVALAFLLHDIGTTDKNLHATHLSFEFHGGILALNLLQEHGGTKNQAEAVCEAIIRHQDMGTDGTITLLGQLVQLSTLYDNVGEHPHIQNYPEILHKDTRDDVNKHFPRNGWCSCFGVAIRKEINLKPWCHTTHIPDFDKQVEGNQLMKGYQ
ncbi:hypothetical protein QQX98_008757 [Neonectria punicea]|uniref:HD domain-containing protein n=1 Tax=Neonectria punicea TaxID=979145 RepID=A0ABR1GU62_9HYPO